MRGFFVSPALSKQFLQVENVLDFEACSRTMMAFSLLIFSVATHSMMLPYFRTRMTHNCKALIGLVVLVSTPLVSLAAQSDSAVDIKNFEPASQMNQLSDVFRKCSFRGSLERSSYSLGAQIYLLTGEVVCKTCDGATVVQCRIVENHKQKSDLNWTTRRESWVEHRWIAESPNPRWTIDLFPAQPEDWPRASLTSSSAELRINRIVAFLKQNQDSAAVWQQVPINDFIKSIDFTGITFADIVSENHDAGFKQKGEPVTDGDGESVTCKYSSDAYGNAEITFLKSANWSPTLIRIEKDADAYVAKKGALPANASKVGDFRTFDTFSSPTAHLDRMEHIYNISYSRLSNGSVVPKRIERTVNFFSNGEKSSNAISLVFYEFDSIGVTCDDVLKQMLPIPDNCIVELVGDASLKKISWTTKNGEIIKRIDPDAINTAKRVSIFHSRPSKMLLANIVVIFIICVFLYRKHYMQTKRVE